VVSRKWLLLLGSRFQGFLNAVILRQKFCRLLLAVATHSAATDFTEINTTTPPLTKILDRLIEGISPCGDVCVTWHAPAATRVGMGFQHYNNIGHPY
jgi:hypothetical protein